MDVLVAMITGMIAASVGAKIPMDQLMPEWRPVPVMTEQDEADIYDAAVAALKAAHPDEDAD